MKTRILLPLLFLGLLLGTQATLQAGGNNNSSKSQYSERQIQKAQRLADKLEQKIQRAETREARVEQRIERLSQKRSWLNALRVRILKVQLHLLQRVRALLEHKLHYIQETYLSKAPTVQTDPVGVVTFSTATFYGQITDAGTDPITEAGFVFGLTTDPTTADAIVNTGTAVGAISTYAGELQASTTYYVRAFATSDAGTAYGEAIAFTTAPPPPPAPTELCVFDPTADGFTLMWEPVAEADTYLVELAYDRDFTQPVPGYEAVDAGTSTVLTFTGLPTGLYFARVRSFNVDGLSIPEGFEAINYQAVAPYKLLFTSAPGNGGTTLGEIFGVYNAAGLNTTNEGTPTCIWTFAGTLSPSSIYGWDDVDMRWEDQEGNDATDLSMPLGTGFALINSNATPDYIVFSGSQRTQQVTLELYQGTTSAARTVATAALTKSITLEEMNFQPTAADGFKGGDGSTMQDRAIVYTYAPEGGSFTVYTYFDNATDDSQDGWYDNLMNRADTVTLPPATVLFIETVTDSAFTTWTLPSDL